MSGEHKPLEGIRVLNYGGAWPGRVASMLFADQGADVLEIEAPGREPRPEDALLGRGKSAIAIDLATEQGCAEALKLARSADIVFDNLGPGRSLRFGLHHAAVSEGNPEVVYVSIPGFAAHSPEGHLPAWEGAICAAMGVYTDIHILGPALGGPPRFSAIPMASAYGGVHAAIAASMGFLHRIRCGHGQLVEVPLADAVMSAMALLIMDVEGQPQRFDLPPIDKVMRQVAFPILRDLDDHLTDSHRARLAKYLTRFGWPMFTTYPCSDGRQLFVNAVEHVHQSRALLEVLGILDELVGAGLIIGSPFDESGNPANVNLATLSLEWRERLSKAIGERLLRKPAIAWEAELARAGVPASVVRTSVEWLNLPEAQAGGNVAVLDDPRFGETRQAGRFVTIKGRDGLASPALRPCQVAATAVWQAERIAPPAPTSDGRGGVLGGLRVRDLSNTIAGPAAARVLAEFGADVVRIDPPAPIAGPRHTMWFGLDVNQGKRALILDLKSEEGRKVLHKMVGQADVVMQNFLDDASRRMGMAADQLHAANPDIVSCQLTAWGGPEGGPKQDDPCYDPVIQFGVGIATRYGSPDAPVLHGVASCVDYMTGFLSALGVSHGLVARALGRGGSHVRTSLSMGGQLVQFPFMVDGAGPLDEPSGQTTMGHGPHQSLYRAADGWIYLGCRSGSIGDVASALGANDLSALSKRIRDLDAAEIARRVTTVPAAIAVKVTRLDELRVACEDPALTAVPGPDDPHSVVMHRAAHPSDHKVSLPLPSWYRPSKSKIRWLAPAPSPGADRVAVLADYGFDEVEIAGLAARRITADGWAVLHHYLAH
jgi:crotonobetainyl-CoA:carnitine CoA-transferase CaiB-like acyl-CoA transferase